VMCGPGLAWKPGLWPGFSRLGPEKIVGQAKVIGFGLARAWQGLSHGLHSENDVFLSVKGRKVILWTFIISVEPIIIRIILYKTVPAFPCVIWIFIIRVILYRGAKD